MKPQAPVGPDLGAAVGPLYSAEHNYDLKSNDAITKTFNKTYAAKYGSTPPNTYFMSYYEGVLIWSQLVQYLQQHHLSYIGSNLRQAILKKRTFHGLGGSHVVFGKNGSAQVPVEMGVVRGGQCTFLKLINPGTPKTKR
jgi:hypothetical protein